MRLETQKQLIYLATRLCPHSENLHNLASNEIKLLGPKFEVSKLAERTYIDDEYPLNRAFTVAFDQDRAEVIFNEINRKRVNLPSRQIRQAVYDATELNDLKPLLPKELFDKLSSDEDSKDRFLDTIGELYGNAFIVGDVFGFPTFWKYCCADYLINKKITPEEALDELSKILDFGALDVKATNPVRFKLMTRGLFYKKLCNVFDVNDDATAAIRALEDLGKKDGLNFRIV